MQVELDTELLTPRLKVATRLGQYPIAQCMDDVGRLRFLNEQVGGQQAEIRVLPAHQRLHRLSVAGDQVNDRQVVHSEIAGRQRGAHHARSDELRHHHVAATFARRPERGAVAACMYLPAPTPGPLGLIEGGIGLIHQFIRGHGPGRGDRHSDATADIG